MMAESTWYASPRFRKYEDGFEVNDNKIIKLQLELASIILINEVVVIDPEWYITHLNNHILSKYLCL